MGTGPGGAISFINSSRTPSVFPAASTNTASCILTKPTQKVDDLMIVVLDAGGVNMTTVPSGWNLLDVYTTVGGQSMTNWVYWKFDAGGEPSTYTWGADSALTPLCGVICTFRGVSMLNPFGNLAVSETTTENPGSDPTISLNQSGTWTLRIARIKATFTSGTTPAEPTSAQSGTNASRRTRTSNRGGTTEYSSELWLDFSAVERRTPLTTTSASFTWTLGATGSPVMAGGIYREIQLNANMTPPRSTNMSMSAVRGSFY